MKMRLFLFISALCLSSFFSSCTPQRNFVKVKGTDFVVDQKPYYFLGTNFWYGAYLGADADYGDRDRLLRELDQLKDLGVKNLRIMAAAEESEFAKPLSPPFQYKDGRYNEELLQGLDFLLAEMGKRDMRAIMVLNNYWEWSGGMSQYVSWATGEKILDPVQDENVSWQDFMNYSARFYTIEEAQQRFRKYIKMMITRKNSFTNKLYKNDPTVMTWELANEPRPMMAGDQDDNVKIFSKWVDETAAYIHSLDKHHLVTTGSEGSIGTLNNLDYARQAHESEHIDYMTIHLWPKNWGWYKPEEPNGMEVSKQNTRDYINKNLEIALEIKKPAVLEEFGFMRDGEKYNPESEVTARNEYYRFLFELIEESMETGSPLAGTNFWAWGGEGRAQHDDYLWQVGDSIYTGDPYMEAQGLNSVFDTDTTTLKIISDSVKRLDAFSSSKKKDK